jgi:integrase
VYQVRTVVLASGERLPILLSSGTPLFFPTAFTLSVHRTSGRAANTIERCLRSIAAMFVACERRDIDVDERVQSGRFLEISELDRLAADLRVRISCGTDGAFRGATETNSARPKVVQLEKYRMGSGCSAGGRLVAPATAATRLRYALKYLSWLSRRRLGELSESAPDYDRYATRRDLFLGDLEERISECPAGSEGREGMSHEEEADLLSTARAITHPTSWIERAAAARNELLVLWLLRLGLRSGELLAVRIGDIDFRATTVAIVRRPDAADDPRRKQPLVKTRGRILPLDSPTPARVPHPESLPEKTQDYVLSIRRRIPGATRHPFLFVDVQTGRPLTQSALAKVFRTFRQRAPLLPRTLTPHVLRHTWNDRFSELMDENRTPPEEEERLREYLQGWKPGSGSASFYTRRHTRERAIRALIDLQQRVLRDDDDV